MTTALVAPVLGAAWAALVLTVAVRHRRPAPARVRAVTATTTTTVRRPAHRLRGRAPTASALTGAAGRLVLRLLGRADRTAAATATADEERDEHERRLGTAVIAAAVAAVIAPWPPILPAIAALVAWWWPAHRRRRRERRRADEIARAVPDVVDLFLLAVDAGLTVPLALRAVARRTGCGTGTGTNDNAGPLADELRRTVHDVDLGRRTADALDDLARPDRAGDAVRPLVAAVVASERYGAPLATSLVRLADEARRQRRRRAEEAARRLPVTLLFPLVTCTLPAFGLLTIGPLIASAARSLRL